MRLTSGAEVMNGRAASPFVGGWGTVLRWTTESTGAMGTPRTVVGRDEFRNSSDRLCQGGLGTGTDGNECDRNESPPAHPVSHGTSLRRARKGAFLCLVLAGLRPLHSFPGRRAERLRPSWSPRHRVCGRFGYAQDCVVVTPHFSSSVNGHVPMCRWPLCHEGAPSRSGELGARCGATRSRWYPVPGRTPRSLLESARRRCPLDTIAEAEH